MRLSTKFVFLIVGTVLVPILVMSLFLVREISDPSGRMLPYQYFRLRQTLVEIEAHGGDPAGIVAAIQRAAPLAEILILDAAGQIVFTSAEVDSAADFLSRDGAFDFSHMSAPAADGSTFSIVIGIQMERRPEARARSSMLILISSILTFMIMMSMMIIRSINRSISRLEVATRRISAGNLDFSLDTKGSDRIASLTRSFETMRKRVQEETAARSRFLMAVSHDLKTPLSSIIGYLDAIQEGMAENPAQFDKYLSIIRDKTGVLESRITQLIDFVKLETDGWYSREEILLAPFLDEAVTVFSTEAEARGFSFHRDIDISRALEISMEVDLVFRVLENLIHNAFRYADAGSSIELQAVQSGQTVILKICNLGVIAENDLPHIFEPFYRGSRSRNADGFGLGLSVVKSVVVSHGWQIAVDSRDGKTCFTVSIGIPEDSRT